MLQLYKNIYQYIEEYWNLLYNIYGIHAVAYPVTFYNIDSTSTVWDDTNLMGGYYEKIGNLSGIRWNKILLLPIFQIEETQTQYDGQDIGLVNEGDSGFVIPSSYGIHPYHNDLVVFNRDFLDVTNTTNSLYTITGVEKQSAQDKTFWKCKLSIESSKIESDLTSQISNTYTFFDYTKKIYTLDDASSLTKILSKNESIRSRVSNLFDKNSGYLFI